MFEYLLPSFADDDEDAGLRLWFERFEATYQAWRVDRCQRLWQLLTSQPFDRLTETRARVTRGLLWTNLGQWTAAYGEYRQVLPIFCEDENGLNGNHRNE